MTSYDASQTSERGNLPELSVSELSGAIKRTVEGSFERVRVRGELSKVSMPSSGHLYTTLKDQNAVLDAVCWRGTVNRLSVRPEIGLEVICTGKITTYPGQSKYQMVIEQMELAGEGALLKLLEDRRRKLAAEGLFEASRKRPIPWLPDVIGVITSPSGAVIRDIVHRISDRFPRHLLVWPVAVQGEACAPQVTAAIEGFNALAATGGAVPRPDLLIVARGGGSVEDLWGFNEESVVRAAAASTIPLISAVGHETDTTLIDLAADWRAPTPTAAAEKAVPVRAELQLQTADLGLRSLGAVERRLAEGRRLADANARALRDPGQWLEPRQQQVDIAAERLGGHLVRRLERAEAKLGQAAARLLHPRELLARKADKLASLTDRRSRALETTLDKAAMRLDRATSGLRPQPLLREANRLSQRLDEVSGRLARQMIETLSRKEHHLEQSARLLESLSFRSVLQRGFALVRDPDGNAVPRRAAISPDLSYTVEFYDDTIPAMLGDGDKTSLTRSRRSPPRPVQQPLLFDED